MPEILQPLSAAPTYFVRSRQKAPPLSVIFPFYAAGEFSMRFFPSALDTGKAFVFLPPRCAAIATPKKPPRCAGKAKSLPRETGETVCAASLRDKKLVFVQYEFGGVALVESAVKHTLRDGVLDFVLNRAAERARAVLGIEPLFGEFGDGLVGGL